MDCPGLFIEVCSGEGWQLEGSEATVTLPGGRQQLLYIEPFLFQGEDMVRVFTTVGAVAALSSVQLHAVMSLNFSLAYGALAFFGDVLVMTDTFLLRELEHNQLAYSMNFLAETADRYEQQIYGTDDH